MLTPHDGEFVRLAGAPPAADRFEALRDAANSLNVFVLLKGPATLIASPPCPPAPPMVLAVTSGTARLATAGSGDVLSGVIAAVLTGDHGPHGVTRAIAAAAHWHGRTASVGSPANRQPMIPLVATAQVEALPAARAALHRPQPEPAQP